MPQQNKCAKLYSWVFVDWNMAGIQTYKWATKRTSEVYHYVNSIPIPYTCSWHKRIIIPLLCIKAPVYSFLWLFCIIYSRWETFTVTMFFSYFLVHMRFISEGLFNYINVYKTCELHLITRPQVKSLATALRKCSVLALKPNVSLWAQFLVNSSWRLIPVLILTHLFHFCSNYCKAWIRRRHR